jgi:hypothetical protein
MKMVKEYLAGPQRVNSKKESFKQLLFIIETLNRI